MALTCPNDGAPLTQAEEHHVVHERCPTCGGGWFTLEEFEELEGSAANQAALAGTIEYAKRPASLSCPSCGKPMTAFDFRGNDLELDACDVEHGFWLGASAVERVRAIMRQREHDLDRSAQAERTWNLERERGFHRDLGEKLRNFFRGR